MLGEILCVVIPVAFFAVLILLVRLYLSWCEKRWDKKEKKLKAKYPEYYQLVKKCNTISIEDKSYEIMGQAQKDIDNITKELPYLPQETLLATEMTLERLKKQYQKAKYEHEQKEAEIRELHQQAMKVYRTIPELVKFYKWAD